MPSSDMLLRVALIRTDDLEERNVSMIKVIRFGEQGTTSVVTSNRRTLRRNMSVLTRATRRKIPEEGILEKQNLHDKIAERHGPLLL
jgi:hypothetical protein